MSFCTSVWTFSHKFAAFCRLIYCQIATRWELLMKVPHFRKLSIAKGDVKNDYCSKGNIGSKKQKSCSANC